MISANLKEFEGKKVDIMCTSECNTNCEHCYVCYKGKRNPEELLTLVSYLKNKYKVMLNGAEVLTNPEYLSSYDCFKKYLANLVNFRLGITPFPSINL